MNLIRLPGPRGTFHNQEKVTKSELIVDRRNQTVQWVAWSKEVYKGGEVDIVIYVAEITWGSEDFPTEQAALWDMRSIAQAHLIEQRPNRVSKDSW